MLSHIDLGPGPRQRDDRPSVNEDRELLDQLLTRLDGLLDKWYDKRPNRDSGCVECELFNLVCRVKRELLMRQLTRKA